MLTFKESLQQVVGECTTPMVNIKSPTLFESSKVIQNYLDNVGDYRLFEVHRKTKSPCIVTILFDRNTGKYAYVNLTSGHICKCRFNTVEEALKDMDDRDDVIDYREI